MADAPSMDKVAGPNGVNVFAVSDADGDAIITRPIADVLKLFAETIVMYYFLVSFVTRLTTP